MHMVRFEFKNKFMWLITDYDVWVFVVISSHDASQLGSYPFNTTYI